MKNEAANRMFRMQDVIKNDEMYRQMQKELKNVDPKLLRLFDEVTPEQKDIIMDYLGLFGALHLRMIELSCETMIFPDEN